MATSDDEYVSIAVALANDRGRLKRICEGLRNRMLASPLMDADGFAWTLAQAIGGMWGQWVAHRSLRISGSDCTEHCSRGGWDYVEVGFGIPDFLIEMGHVLSHYRVKMVGEDFRAWVQVANDS